MGDTRCLNEREDRAWRAFLLASQLLMEQLDRELQERARIPHAYYAILAVLAEQPERALRMTEIADRLRFSRSRLTHAIGRLEERGWVERAACPTDRRGAYAVLTEAGQQALAAAAPTHVAGVRRHLFDRLSVEQVEQLCAIGEAVVAPLVAEETWKTSRTERVCVSGTIRADGRASASHSHETRPTRAAVDACSAFAEPSPGGHDPRVR